MSMHNGFWDRLGISASLACMLHCMLTPLLVLLMPVVGEFLSHIWFHLLILFIVFPVAVWALWRGYKEHRIQRMLWLGGIGLTLIFIAMFFGDNTFWGANAMILAGLFLSLAHYLNLRACRIDSRST